MELTRVSKTALNLSSEVELLSYTLPAGNTREIIARAEIGDAVNALSGSGGVYSVRYYIDGIRVLPDSDINFPVGLTRAVLVSRAVPVEPGEVVGIRLLGQAGDTSVNTVTSLRNATPVLASDLAGDGSVAVNHNYGGTDALTYEDDGVGIDNATIRAYLASEYNAGNRSAEYVVATSYTNVEGRWTVTMMLDPDDYILVFHKQGCFGPDEVAVTVA